MTTELQAADRELKAKHRAMWASGDYPAVVERLVSGLGPLLVEAAGIGEGDRVLDVGAGTGNAAIPAERAGASVVASDLTPELLDVGRARAAEAGVELEWAVADAEALPFGDGEFDVVMSCIGAMFAPHHQPVADELVRVCRPGGTVAMLNWTPDGFVGQMFAALKPFAPPPPPGAQPPPLWGSEDHVRELFGDRLGDLVLGRGTMTWEGFADAVEARDFMKRVYGPTIAVYKFLGDDAERVQALDEALLRHLEAFGEDGGDGYRAPAEYLIVKGRRA